MSLRFSRDATSAATALLTHLIGAAPVLFKLVLSLILALLAVLFVVQNVAVVEVRFLLWGLHMTLSLLIFLLFGCGIIVGWLMHSYLAYRRKLSTASEVRRDAAYRAEKNEPLPPGSGV